MLGLRAVARHNGIFRPSAALTRPGTRHLQTKTVTDADIARYAAKPLYPLTLADLCKHGRPPLSEQSLLNSANFTLGILPSRLAHRIQSLRALPYIVVANPNVSQIHQNYVHSLSTLLPFAERNIESLEEEIKFTEVMADLVQTHNNTIAILARGFLEARKYITKDEITRFLDEHLRARIGTRLIAEQHIALHFSSQPHRELSDHPDDAPPSYIGVIDTALRPADIIRNCEHTVGEICELKYGVRPTIVLKGSPESSIAHIPMHIEYILTELLKNSFRATIEAGMEKEPIEITIAPAPAAEDSHSRHSKLQKQQKHGQKEGAPVGVISNYDQGSVDHASGSSGPDYAVSANIRPLDKQSPGVTIRIRDRGGGIGPENYSKLWEYGFTTFNEDEILDKVSGGNRGVDALDAISGGAAGGSSLAGLGYGLPLGRAYAEYFGGGIAVQSMWGWGTDVYLSLRGVGKIVE
ncbi:[3-methyl-2-oxobutanoate dehydrogenase [lipoamide]] kinase, mitochondrial [Fulvia fulva]|uniref:Protein-serine/threonine kinase n=1 Tax=Passalora fulva TaxID=5499 RepID=A0A9Q8P4S6_PASFU|nr:[3-methyl-2-oxobutanoate dehydrogenase [lipoamide]] kinase, mitochondrial [Fulvia fulva]KAK4631523.1 [3-methyl-2-oxobutanoate dehydrogenase [lipoamide]] kinase, mitochondrial [Fulvia fulva]KAK4633764.1 [3-methyl-2-oxobutanoate dehydrogenase [lipoamide]] kinase, mitochondrial [Fulvia fulva]UJO13395.1 [3-methyl-2-oxobutanoate dehydrogenase [lipoamide]] kinase, mitochondrial [Fulvia fulva]WPV11023.1 [3-methyl-2-oxobutanoate dehydrogenase [lipoamide]] kinase, mitochondrial [Fulvia fulva]WPV2687